MKGLVEIIATLRSLGEPAAVATLVRAKGSSYRKPGARMIFRPGGPQTGSISAGCMETDVKERVAEVLAEGRPALIAFDMGSDLDLIWGTGMGCMGKAEVLLERVGPGEAPPWMALCEGMLHQRRTGVMATVFAARGGAPANVGDRFIREGGLDLLPVPPSLAGPLSEAMDGGGRACTLRLAAWELDLLVEPLLPPLALWVFGAGENARPLLRIAKELGWYLGLADHRSALATPERFPEADRIVVGHPPEVLQNLPFDARTAALVVSHVFEADKAALAALLKAPVGYLGLQGNRKRSERILREIALEEGPPTAAAQAALHYPAGLDLGAEAPEGIALSMLSEIQAVLSGRTGSSLRDVPGPIH
jgi:xanthine dehydrogenase accessory factor